MNKLDNKGFSLIEVIVAVILMTIIIGVVTVKYEDSVENAKEQKAESELQSIQYAVSQYYKNTNTYPIADVFTGNNSNIDAKLGSYLDGNLDSSWFTSCSDLANDNVLGIGGVYIGMHHIGVDLQTNLYSAFQKICPYTVKTGNSASTGNYVLCIMKPATAITCVNGNTPPCNQCS